MRSYIRGVDGEGVARIYLESLGYKVVDSRVRLAGAELDMIALKDNFIVFIEVKTRKQPQEEYLSPHQCKRYIVAAEEYVGQRPELAKLAIRFDLVVVIGAKVYEHLEDAWSGWDF